MYSIIKNHIVLMVMGMGGRAELYSCILFDIVLEYFCHIIIEHICKRMCMHADYGFFKLICPVRQFLFHKTEIGNRLRIIIFQRIGIKADEFHIARNE